jgi:hypothetical protein
MKRTTRDRTRVYAQSARAYNRSAFVALVRAALGRSNVVRGVVEDAGTVSFYSGTARKPQNQGPRP